VSMLLDHRPVSMGHELMAASILARIVFIFSSSTCLFPKTFHMQHFVVSISLQYASYLLLLLSRCWINHFLVHQHTHFWPREHFSALYPHTWIVLGSNPCILLAMFVDTRYSFTVSCSFVICKNHRLSAVTSNWRTQ
jgi:hypothetical protein